MRRVAVRAALENLVLVVRKLELDAARVEEQFKAEIYNEELYGPDPHEEKKDTAKKNDLEASAQFLECL